MRSSAPARYVVRVDGLTSAKGQQLNGLVGVCKSFEGSERRIPVWLDGHVAPLSIARANVTPLAPRHADYRTNQILDLGVGVGRQHLREDRWRAVITDNGARTPTILAQTEIESADSCPRFQASISVILAGLEAKERDLPPSVVVQVTDLNLAEALNRIAAGVGDFEPPLYGRDWQRLVEWIQNQTRRHQRLIMFRYKPHRLEPDEWTTQGRGVERLKNVQKGTFHLYPCNAPNQRDALEVRYCGSSVNRPETWLDYGRVESMRYVEHAMALGSWERLSPSVMAQVDPPAFWSAILHYSHVIKKLKQQGGDSRVLDEWKELESGLTSWKKAIGGLSDHMELELLPDENGRWSLENEQQHELLSLRNAHAALLHTLERGGNEGIYEVLKDIQISDDYRGTRLDRDFKYFRQVIASGDTKEFARIAYILTLGLSPDTADVCAKCGSSEKISLCSRCKCVAYCSRDCQVSHLKEHKKVCNKIAGPEESMIKLYKPRSKLPTRRVGYSEVSGIGRISIFWMGREGQSPIQNQIHHQSNFGGHQQRIEFRYIRELPPVWRFMVSCGPLPGLVTAQSCLDEALAAVGGDPTLLRVESAGFTALEWAAKKGNEETVKWLCEDARTKALIRVGSPIGWAAYTGQVGIMRLLIDYGADTAATDDVLWGCQQPLLVAASNGQLEAMTFLVEECGHDIRMKDAMGRNVLDNIAQRSDWKKLEGHRKAHKWAKRKLGASS